MSETTPLIKAALNLRVGVGFDVYFSERSRSEITPIKGPILFLIFYFPQISKNKIFLLRFSNEQKTTPNVLRKKKFVIGGGRYV